MGHEQIKRKQERRGHRGHLVQLKQLSVGLTFPTEGLEIQDSTPTSTLNASCIYFSTIQITIMLYTIAGSSFSVLGVIQ